MLCWKDFAPPRSTRPAGRRFRDLEENQSSIIFCSLTGYGQKNRQSAGHDLNYLVSSGLFSALLTDHPPFIPGIPLADLIGGLAGGFSDLRRPSVPETKT